MIDQIFKQTPTNILWFSIAGAFIPIFVYILFLRWLDRYEREPMKNVIFTFLLGASLSVFLSWHGNNFVTQLSAKYLTATGTEFISAGFVAPIVEETSKGLIILILMLISSEVDNLTDGILYGAIVGLGFAFSENVFYFTGVFKNSGQFAWIENIYIRSFFCTGLHACTTAIFAAAMAYAKFAKWKEKIVLGLMGWGLAVMVHSFWNSLLTAAELSNDSVLSDVPLYCLPALYILLLVMFQFSLAQESHMLEEELMDEAKNGLIPQAHVAYLKSYFGRSKVGWLDPQIPKDKYIHLTTDLAFLKHQYWLSTDKKRPSYEQKINTVREEIKKLFAVTEPTQT